MSALVDRPKLLDRFDQDLEFLAETLEILESDGPALLEEVRAACAAGDSATMAKKAHALKGMVANFSAPAVTEQILEIELNGRAGDLDGVPPKLDRFAESFDGLCSEVRSIASGEAP